MAFGSQLGQALGQLAGEVLTSSDIGLPLGPEATAALLPGAVARFTDGLDRPASEVLVFLAAREAAHHRLFGHVPWLRQRLLATVEEFARGITIDTSRIEELARDLDPSNPAAIEQAMSSGLFEPQTTEAQKAALARLETLLALVEGWVDHVVAAAVGDRLPGASALRESMRRRRASGGPAEQTFATLVGLQLRPRRLREAAALWSAVEQARGIDGRDALWAHPDLLPGGEDLDDPAAFVARTGSMSEGETSGTDWDAELRRMEGGLGDDT
jgi:putative hydrolase